MFLACSIDLTNWGFGLNLLSPGRRYDARLAVETVITESGRTDEGNPFIKCK